MEDIKTLGNVRDFDDMNILGDVRNKISVVFIGFRGFVMYVEDVRCAYKFIYEEYEKEAGYIMYVR